MAFPTPSTSKILGFKKEQARPVVAPQPMDRARSSMAGASGTPQVAFLSAINEAYMAGPLIRHSHLQGKPNVAIQLGFSEDAIIKIELPAHRLALGGR